MPVLTLPPVLLTQSQSWGSGEGRSRLSAYTPYTGFYWGCTLTSGTQCQQLGPLLFHFIFLLCGDGFVGFRLQRPFKI